MLEAAGYIRRHAILIPILLLLPLPFTAVHEGAHAAAAMLQGARITEFAVGPWTSGGRHWGFMRYEVPPGTEICAACVSLAPYVTWALVGFATALIAFRLPRKNRERSALMVIGFALPPLDLVQHLGPWIVRSSLNDLTQAFGPPTWTVLAGIAVYGLLVLVAGHAVQRRLHGDHSLSLGAYLLLAATTAFSASVLSILFKHLLS